MINILGFLLILTACYATGKIVIRANFDYQILFVSRLYVGIFLVSLLLFIVLWKFENIFPLYCKSLIIYGLIYLIYKIISLKSIFNSFKIIIKKIKLIDFILILILLVYFPSILFPPTAADSLSYHFVIAKLYSEKSRMVDDPSFYFHMPHIFQLFSSIIYYLFGYEYLKSLHYINLIMLVILLYYIGRNILKNKIIAIILPIIFLLTPMIIQIGTSGHLEILMSCILTLIFILIIKIFEINNFGIRESFIIGILLSFLLSIKYYGIIYFASLTLSSCIGISLINNSKKYKLYILIATSSFIAIILSAIFYYKNYLDTNLILFPENYFSNHTDYISSELLSIIKSFNSENKKPLEYNFYGFFEGLFLIFFGSEKIDGALNGLGPIALLLIYIPFLYIFKIKLKENKALYLYGSILILLSYFLWFFLAFQRLRHLIAIYPLLLILLVNNYKLIIFSVKEKYRIIYSLPIIIFIAYGSLTAIYYYKNDFYSIYKGYSHDEYLFNYSRISYEIKKISSFLPENSKILTTFGSNRFYHMRDNIYLSPYFQSHYDFTKINSSVELYNKIKSENITHIIFNSNTINRISENNYEIKLWNIFRDLVKNNTSDCYEKIFYFSKSITKQDYSIKDSIIICNVLY